MSETGKSQSKSLSPFFLYGVCTLAGVVIGVFGGMFLKGESGSDPVVAEFQGKKLRASEIFGGVKTRLFDLEEEMFRTKESAINDYIERRLVEDEAKRQNLRAEELLEKNMGGPVAEVNDADVDSFLASKGLSLNNKNIRKEDVREYLKYLKRFDKRQAYVAQLKEKAKVKILLKEPESPKISVTTEGFPKWGNDSAKVTIVEFSDYQCPFCSQAVPTLDKIKSEYGPDKVRIVFRDMPIRSHPRALPASLAAHCANEQGKFWEYHNTLFQNQQRLEDNDLKAFAKTLGMDETKFGECFNTKRHMPTIEKSMREAEALGISATPSFVINGILIQGAVPFPRFKEKIDKALRG